LISIAESSFFGGPMLGALRTRASCEIEDELDMKRKAARDLSTHRMMHKVVARVSHTTIAYAHVIYISSHDLNGGLTPPGYRRELTTVC